MKTQSFLTVCLALSLSSVAQINLDKPIPVGVGDHVYQSVTDPSVAYAFPLYVEIAGGSKIKEDRRYVSSEFTASVSETSLKALQQTIKTNLKRDLAVRVLLGLNAAIADQAADIPSEYQPTLLVLGDPGNLGQPVKYELRLKKKRGAKQILTKAMQSSQARHVGTIKYQFNAVQGDKPYLGQTAVGVFVGNFSNEYPASANLASWSRTFEIASVQALETPSTGLDGGKPTIASASLALDRAGIRILTDKDTGCWAKPRPGEVCLRE